MDGSSNAGSGAGPGAGPEQPRDAANWAPPVTKLHVVQAPSGAVNLNVDGRGVVGALQGFGQLWQKTYRMRMDGAPVTPAEVMQVWKENFPRFQPPENHFTPSLGGLRPGEVLFIDAVVPAIPGTRSILPVASGVMVLYADEYSFTVMTPEGFPESGWNTFSAFEDDGVVVAQVQSLCRATDPIYEFAFRFLGSSNQQEKIWAYVLTALGAYFGVQGEVSVSKICLDPKLQWSQAKNIWKNAGIRTILHKLTHPFQAKPPQRMG